MKNDGGKRSKRLRISMPYISKKGVLITDKHIKQIEDKFERPTSDDMKEEIRRLNDHTLSRSKHPEFPPDVRKNGT
ncbi:MAG: hypothetical protein QMC77_07905 [Methanocellales archaeon]|nr:hypothetical protein [Methanocellales archaeon]